MMTEPSSDETTLEIEPASMRASGRCACCGKSRRTAWGYVYRNGGPRACYFVEWTTGQQTCTAIVDVVIGRWFDGTTEDDREAVSLEYSLLPTGPSFSPVDATGRPAAEVGRATKAIELTGTALVEEAITMANAIFEVDDRIRELTVADEPNRIAAS